MVTDYACVPGNPLHWTRVIICSVALGSRSVVIVIDSTKGVLCSSLHPNRTGFECKQKSFKHIVRLY